MIKNEVIYGASRHDKDGQPIVEAPLTELSNTADKVCLGKGPWVIPIVFIPGVMGTNLRVKGSHEAVWRPPNNDLRGTFEVIGALATYLFKRAADRQRELNKDTVEIDPDGPKSAGGSGLPKDTLQKRHWGTIMRSCYHPVLGFLQQQLNDIMQMKQLQGWWVEHAQRSPGDYGDEKNGAALTEDELLHAARYRYDVWVGGYNWLQSNADSGKAIKDWIENEVLPSYDKCDLRAKKVIVVTHSMGGLVSRALTELHGCDKVLGVVHGVQPATGAPAAYKRMRAGFEGAAQVVLGRNAGEVTAVLANAPGPLELLPTFDYDGGKAWLKVRDRSGGAELLALPKSGDPYEEIYASPKWYGLVPEANDGLIDPAGNIQRNVGQRSPREIFESAIENVGLFHHLLAPKYHPETHAYYGAESKKKARLQWRELVWEGSGLREFKPESARVERDNYNGELTLVGGERLQIAGPAGPGDGTVPQPSGAAPGQARVKTSFCHGSEGAGKYNETASYEHQESYNDERARWATLYGIVKIAQQADWHE